jgi:hypothetical protein
MEDITSIGRGIKDKLHIIQTKRDPLPIPIPQVKHRIILTSTQTMGDSQRINRLSSETSYGGSNQVELIDNIIEQLQNISTNIKQQKTNSTDSPA